ncbi:MAG TPA: universal stress protein [Anaeromyxobacteraceae bacterium]|nr:universal stress protein [Anaeromyxobacteraceae bacterium]
MAEVGFLVRRIVVGLDASEPSLDALSAAAARARRLGSDLRALFVEDQDLLRLAALPFAQEARTPAGAFDRLVRDEVEAQLRALAARARQALERAAARVQVSFTFEVARGAVTPRVLAAAGEEDLLVLGAGGHARSGRTAPGGTARAAARDARASVLLLARGARMGDPVVAVHDGAPGSARAVAAAARLAAPDEGPVVLVSAERAEPLSAEARALAGPRVRIRSVRRGRPWLRSALVELRPALLALGAGSGALAGDGLEDLLALGAPVLLVRGEAGTRARAP